MAEQLRYAACRAWVVELRGLMAINAERYSAAEMRNGLAQQAMKRVMMHIFKNGPLEVGMGR